MSWEDNYTQDLVLVARCFEGNGDEVEFDGNDPDHLCVFVTRGHLILLGPKDEERLLAILLRRQELKKEKV